MHEPLSDIHSCISLIEQVAGLPFNPSSLVTDLTFQLCNMGGELVSVEGLGDSLGQSVNSGLLHDPGRWHSGEAWIGFQRLITQG